MGRLKVLVSGVFLEDFGACGADVVLVARAPFLELLPPACERRQRVGCGRDARKRLEDPVSGLLDVRRRVGQLLIKRPDGFFAGRDQRLVVLGRGLGRFPLDRAPGGVVPAIHEGARQRLKLGAQRLAPAAPLLGLRREKVQPMARVLRARFPRDELRLGLLVLSIEIAQLGLVGFDRGLGRTQVGQQPRFLHALSIHRRAQLGGLRAPLLEPGGGRPEFEDFQLVVRVAVPLGFPGLAVEGGQLTLDLSHDVADAQQVLLGRIQFAQRFGLADFVLGNSRRLFDQRPPLER